MGMESFYPKGNWVKRKSRIKESVESLNGYLRKQ